MNIEFDNSEYTREKCFYWDSLSLYTKCRCFFRERQKI